MEGKRDNVAVHSHPIADSVSQLSVASFVVAIFVRIWIPAL